jgi:hypothetical protein
MLRTLGPKVGGILPRRAGLPCTNVRHPQQGKVRLGVGVHPTQRPFVKLFARSSDDEEDEDEGEIPEVCLLLVV